MSKIVKLFPPNKRRIRSSGGGGPVDTEPNFIFPSTLTNEILNVLDSATNQAGANFLVPNDASLATQNTTRLRVLLVQNASGNPGQGAPTGAKPLYFPNGVYWLNGRVTWTRELTLLGQSRDGTIFKWVDNSSGLLPVSGEFVACMDACGVQSDQSGFGFRTFLMNFTIDAGNNPDCIGMSYYLNNDAGMSNVKIKGNGRVGLGARSGSFPAGADYIEVEGFQYGIWCGSGSAFYNVVLKNQTVAAIAHTSTILQPTYVPEVTGSTFLGGGSGQGGNTGSFINVVSTQVNANVPFLIADRTNTTSGSNLTVANATLTGNGGHAIQHKSEPSVNKIATFCHFENVTQTGYSCMVVDTGFNTVSGLTNLPRFYNHHKGFSAEAPLTGAFDGWPTFPRMKIPDPAISVWKTSREFGATDGNSGNDLAAFQALIDDTTVDVAVFSARTTSGENTGYYLGDTLIIRGNRGGRDLHVLGFAPVDPVNGAFPSKPVIRIESIGGGTVYFWKVLNAIHDNNPAYIPFEHASSGDAVFYYCKSNSTATSRTTWTGAGYRVDPAYVGTAGNVFFNSSLINRATFSNNQKAILINANWQAIGGSNSLPLETLDYIVVKGGASVLASAPRHENTRGNGTLDSRTWKVSDNGTLVTINSWIDNTYSGANPGPALDLTGTGKFHGMVGQHGNLNQAFPIILGVNRGSGYSYLYKDTDVPMVFKEVNNGAVPGVYKGTQVYMATSACSSFGGTSATAPTPVLMSAIIHSLTGATRLVLTFDFPLQETPIAPTGSFAVTVNGVARAINSLTIYSQCVSLVLASAVTSGQTVLVSYTNGSNRLKGFHQARNIADFSNQSVTNLV